MNSRRTLLKFIMLAACACLGGHAYASETVSIGHLGLISDAPFYIGIEEGYFKKHGIDVKLERYTSAAQAMAQLATGDIKVVGGGISPALFNAFARGFEMKIVAARTREIPGRTISSVMVRSDLKDQIKSFADLKGRKIALNAPGSPHVFIMGKALESAGLTLKDVDVAYMSFPDMRAAFLSKAIDAAIVSEPFVAQYQRANVANAWRHTPDIIKNPPLELAVVIYNADWAKNDPKAARDFMTGYLRSVRDFEIAATGGSTRARVVEILTKYTNVKDPTVYEEMAWPYTDPKGVVAADSISEIQDWFMKQGQVKQHVPVEKMIDAEYGDYAREQLSHSPTAK
jgi:NitT/TauT family transport system substrate-binding protein